VKIRPIRVHPCSIGSRGNADLGQALELLNGPTVADKVRDPKNRLGEILAKKLSDVEVLDELYLTALSRPPSEGAAKAFLGHVGRAADRRKAWEDVLWTLLRSEEFTHRH
jgi:hypothetical protein